MKTMLENGKYDYSYGTTKEEQLNGTLTTKILGVPLELDSRSNLQIAKRIGCIPIDFGCYCVHDSPDNPCPCKDRPPIIVWLPEDEILKSGKADILNHDGRELHYYEVNRDAKILVERIFKINVARLNRTANRDRNYSSGSKFPSVLAKKLSNKELLGLAFSAGWWVGEQIDDEFDLSDKLSDLMLDVFGPWPF